MKKLFLWVIPLSFLLAACQKEVETPERTVSELKKFGAVENGVKKPAKGEMFGISRFDIPPVECAPGLSLPGGMYMGGSGTGTGELRLMESPYFSEGCEFDPTTMTLTQWGHGTVTIENGDSYFIKGRVKLNMLNMTFTGDVIINDGTGKYKGAYGEVKMYDGYLDMNTGTHHWKYDGWIIFKKK